MLTYLLQFSFRTIGVENIPNLYIRSYFEVMKSGIFTENIWETILQNLDKSWEMDHET